MKLGALFAMAAEDGRAARGRSIVSLLGIGLGVGVLTTIVALGIGVRSTVLNEVVLRLPFDMVEVVPKSVNLGIFKLGGAGILGGRTIDDSTVSVLKGIPDVAAVYPKLEVKLPLGAHGGEALLGKTLYADLFVNGLPEELLETEVGPAFADNPNYLPVVVSSQLLELYNGSVAGVLGTPQLTPQTLTGIEFDVWIGRSLLLGQQGARTTGRERAHVVGVSRHAVRLGASLPMATAKRLIAKYGDDTPASYTSVILKATSATDVPAIAKAVRAQGLDVDATAQHTAELMSGATAAASLIGLLVLALAALNIAHSFVALLAERRRELGVLRAMGATRSDLVGMVLVQALLLGLIGGVLGVAAAYGVSAIADQLAAVALPDFPFKPRSFFAYPWWLPFAGVLAAVVASCGGALWPAIGAARQDVTAALAE
ncbi:MAG: ABC transporter permease [Clostridia bacterium]|nr:ABC transporter permease [Deltaproteobacteria bacterium]